MLSNDDLISNYLININKNAKITSNVIFNETAKILSIKAHEQLTKTYQKFSVFFKSFLFRESFDEKWQKVVQIQQSSEKLDLIYQRNLQPEEIDLRFFIREKKQNNEKGAHKITPFQKQKLVYKQFLPESKNCRPRVLDFDMTSEPPKVETIKTNGQFTQINDCSFQKMMQSPYKPTSYVPASPLTNGMQLYNWLSEKVTKSFVSTDGHLADHRLSTPLGRFINTLDAEYQHKILRTVVHEKVSSIVVLDQLNKKSGTKSSAIDQKRLQEERRNLLINFYYHCLNDFIVNQEQKKNQNLEKILKSINFHKTLLSYSIESIFYILNIPNVTFQDILSIIEIPVSCLYEININILNFEALVPIKLKDHFFEIEKLILSYHLWEKNSPALKLEIIGENAIIFERATVHASQIVSLLGQQLKMPTLYLEKVWTLFRNIFLDKRLFLAEKFLEQVIMCCFYSISKIFELSFKFQDIISCLQKAFLHYSKSIINSIIFACPLNSSEKTDIITFYNEKFIVECKSIILDVASKNDDLENLPQNFDKNLMFFTNKNGSPNRANVNEYEKTVLNYGELNRELDAAKVTKILRSPLRTLISTPFHSYNREEMMRGVTDLMKSPTSMMMKMYPQNEKVPLQSKKILNLNMVDEKNEGGNKFIKKEKNFEKKQAFEGSNFDAVESCFKKY